MEIVGRGVAVLFIIAWIVGSVYGIWSYWFSPFLPTWLTRDLQAFLLVGLGGALGATVKNIPSLVWYCTTVDENQYEREKKERPSRCVHLIIQPMLNPFAGAILAFAFVFALLGVTSDLLRAFVFAILAGLFVDTVVDALRKMLPT